MKKNYNLNNKSFLQEDFKQAPLLTEDKGPLKNTRND